jgi:hypothetical protein
MLRYNQNKAQNVIKLIRIIQLRNYVTKTKGPSPLVDDVSVKPSRVDGLPLKMGWMLSQNVAKYQHTLHNIPEEQGPQPQRVGSLKS